MDPESVKVSAFLVQGLATICIAYLVNLTGYIFAWPSYTTANFESKNTVLSRPMNSLEVGLLGSLTNIGALIATPFCGYLVNTLGRKRSAILFGLPYIISWTLIIFTKEIYLVLFAMFLAGFGAAGQVVSSVYIGEISQDSIRGALTSSTVTGYFVGLLFSYIIGGYLSYMQVLYVHLAMSIIYIILLLLLKESPVFLLMKGRTEEAAKSIAFYRHVPVESKEVEYEINKIKMQIDPKLAEILDNDNEVELTIDLLNKKETETQEPQESEWRFLMKSKSSKKALMAVLMVMALTIMMGSIILQVYAEKLFHEAVPLMPSNLCAIFMALDFLIASFICSLFVDKYGRKILLTVTSALSGVCTIVLAVQLQSSFLPQWMTVVLIYLYCLIYTMGAAVVPFILTSEVFLPEVRGICTSISMGCMWLMNFVTVIIFIPVVENYGLGPVFYGFAVVCFCSAIYSHLCLPETSGLPVDEIQLKFLKKSKKHIKN